MAKSITSVTRSAVSIYTVEVLKFSERAEFGGPYAARKCRLRFARAECRRGIALGKIESQCARWADGTNRHCYGRGFPPALYGAGSDRPHWRNAVVARGALEPGARSLPGGPPA